MVESWSSSLEPKCANRPLLLMPRSPARAAIESPSSPSDEASCIARERIARRVLSPRRRRPSVTAAVAVMAKKITRPFVYVQLFDRPFDLLPPQRSHGCPPLPPDRKSVV